MNIKQLARNLTQALQNVNLLLRYEFDYVLPNGTKRHESVSLQELLQSFNEPIATIQSHAETSMVLPRHASELRSMTPDMHNLRVMLDGNPSMSRMAKLTQSELQREHEYYCPLKQTGLLTPEDALAWREGATADSPIDLANLWTFLDRPLSAPHEFQHWIDSLKRTDCTFIRGYSPLNRSYITFFREQLLNLLECYQLFSEGENRASLPILSCQN